MNLRSKSIGLLAGAILAVGSVAGVVAQDTSSNTADTNATLLENTSENDGDGICSALVTAHDFGDFRWNGSAYVKVVLIEGKYVEVEGNGFEGKFTVTTNQTISPVDVTCKYQFTGENLKITGDATNVISASQIALTSGVDETTVALGQTSSFSLPVSSIPNQTTRDIEYDLTNAIGTQKPQEYGGTITVTTVGRAEPGQD